MVFVFFLIPYLCDNLESLQGEEARNFPGESVSEEHFLDKEGNLISRKVTYKT